MTFPSGSSGHRNGGLLAILAVLLATAGVALVPVPAQAAPPGVDPPEVTLTLGPGGSAQVAKVVHTPPVPPKPDIVFLADTTFSMNVAIGDVRANATQIVADVTAVQPTAQFAVAEYRDLLADPVGFAVNQGLTGDGTAVQAGINQWVASGGGDLPEDGLNGLYQLATGAVTFRPDGTRIVAIFGDAVSNDPSGGHTLADVIAALQAADIRVVAVNVGPAGGGLNQGGQIAAVTSATGGVFLDNVASNEVSEAILAGIQAIQVTVTPSVVSCGSALSLSFNPPSRLVPSGDDAAFTETVLVAGNAAAGTYHCTVDFLVDGVSQGFVQQAHVVVPGLSIDDVGVNEAGGVAGFTVTLSAPSPDPVTVSFVTSNGTAVAPGDYSSGGGMVTFNPGQLTRPVSVPIVDDAVDELNEAFTVVLSNPTGAALVDPAGVGTIVDNDRDGTFSCTSTALNVAGLTAGLANPADVPCVDDAQTVALAQLNAGLVTVRANGLSASTDQTPNLPGSQPPAAGDSAVASAGVVSTRITVGLVTIEFGLIQSTATVTCVAGPGGLVPSFTSSSIVSSLKINGVTVTIGTGPTTIPLLIGSLRLNSTQTTATSVVRRAVVLDTLLTDVVIGEAKANIEGTAAHPTGTPCRA